MPIRRPFAHIYLPVLVGNMLATINMGAISVAMPFLAKAAGVSPAQALALPSGYVIGLVAAAVLSGYLSRRYGERNTLSLAIAGLITTNVLAVAFADNYLVLIALVVAQGGFAGPIPPITQKLIAVNFPEDIRAPRMAFWQGGLTAGAVLGSVVGGSLLSVFGGQWVFAMAPVLGVVALGIILTQSSNERDPTVAFDATAFVLLLVLVVSLAAFLQFGQQLGWFKSPIVLGLTASAGVSGILLAWALRRETRRMLDLSVLQNRDLAVGLAVVVVFFGIGTGHLQNQMLVWVFEFGPDAIAQRLGYGGPARLGGIILCGFLTARYATRNVMLLALFLVMIGKFGYVLWSPGLSQAGAVIPFVIHSVGGGMLMVCLAALAYTTLDKSQMASAAILYVLAQRLGGSVGLGSLGAAEGMVQSSLAGAGYPADLAQGAAFLTVSWIELVLVIPLILAVFLFSQARRTRRVAA